MQILILGATGSIGSSVTAELIEHKHKVVALARSDQSERSLTQKAIHVIRGDLRTPEQWIEIIHDIDAIIHVAATFSDDMGDVDLRLIQTLILETRKRQSKLKFIYTGGCWLYGETGNRIATETDDLNPIPAFKWMIENSKLAFQSPNLDVILIHPAMVYDRNGGVLSRFIEAAKKKDRVEVWGSLNTRWPVVHHQDLASAYRLAVEHGIAGEAYNVSAQDGVKVGDIIEAIGKRFGVKLSPRIRSQEESTLEYDDYWAIGSALDQQMSGQKIKDAFNWVPKISDIIKEIC